MLEKIAGKRGGQIVAATIRNFDAAEKAMENMANSSGSAQKEMELVEQTIDYKLNQLKETWVGVWQDILKRDDLKAIVSMLSGLSEALGGVISTLGAIPSLGMGVGAFLGIKNLGRRRK